MIAESIKSPQRFILNDSSLELFLATFVFKHIKLHIFQMNCYILELFRRNISRINSSIKILNFLTLTVINFLIYLQLMI